MFSPKGGTKRDVGPSAKWGVVQISSEDERSYLHIKCASIPFATKVCLTDIEIQGVWFVTVLCREPFLLHSVHRPGEAGYNEGVFGTLAKIRKDLTAVVTDSSVEP